MFSGLMRSILLRFVGSTALVALLPLALSAQDAKPAAELPDPVAVVEGEKISRADLEDTFKSALAFKAEMAKAGETDSSFRDSVKKMMQQQKWMESQIGDKASVADADIKKFYDENKKEFEHPEMVRASHILILVPEDASDEVVAEKKKAADAALARVTTKKEDFTAVAKEVSEEPGAKESGGDLNFFPKDRMVPEFANAAFAMKKGDISKAPVRTKFGWHVINVTDRKDSGSMPFEEVKGQVGSYL